MKRLFLTLSLSFLLIQISKAQITLPPSGSNQKSSVTQQIGSLVKVTIKYSSPDVTGPNGQSRKGNIWGQLVPYGLAPNNFGSANEIPWRAGANENTVIKFSHDVLINGNAIAAGAYSIHMIPTETGPWTIIFNKDTESWGSYFYTQENDALRIEVTPENIEYQEWLNYEFTDRQNDKATCALQWEHKSIPFTIEVANYNDLYVENIEDELKSSKGFVWTNWNAAANYALSNNTHLEKGLEWAEFAVSGNFIGQKNFTTLTTKANILMALNRNDEAAAIVNEAIPMGTANQLHGLGRTLITNGLKDKALDVFQKNHEMNDGAWPTEVGMARGFSAVGNYAKALEHCRIAHMQAPDKLNKDNLASAIEKLEKKEDIN